MAGPLTTRAQLSVWVGEIPADLQAFADDVIQQASDAVAEAAHQPDWTVDTAPTKAKRIAFQVARRTYQNPGSEIASNIGPLGSRVTDTQASGVYLTEEEKAELAEFWPAADQPKAGGELYVVSTDDSPPVDDGLIYLADESGSLLLYGDTADPITTIALTPDA